MLKSFKDRYNGNPAITSYDVLKAVAVIFMIIDHCGVYFWSLDPDYRLVGRFAAPIFLFLVGYSVRRDIPREMWIGNILLMMSAFLTSEHIFPQSILLTIILVRLFLDRVAQVAFSSPYMMFCTVFTFFFFSYPSSFLFDYGLFGFLFALCGYAARHRDEFPLEAPYRYILCTAVIILYTVLYTVYESARFHFDMTHGILLSVGMILLAVVMERFRPLSFPRISARCPIAISGAIRFLGRYTLEIYVVHLAIFRLVAAAMQDKHPWLHLKFFPWSESFDIINLAGIF